MNVASLPSSIGATRDSRRTATRRSVVLPCQAVRERDFKLVAEQTLDVSVDGLLLPIAEPILTGEQLVVSFSIPGKWIDAEATVVRVVHGRRPHDEGLAVGVLFDVISPSSRAALAAFLHGRPPPLPRRGPLARLRRGLGTPQLADQAMMEQPLAAPDPFMPEIDVDEDVVEDDALGVLCEVASAWRRILASS
jgi:hypothetical protein